MSFLALDRRAVARLMLPALVACAALFAGCATPVGSPGRATGGGPVEPPLVTPGSPPATTARPAPGAAPGTAPATPLGTEQRFLEDWFRGTPVVISAQNATTLQVDVPLANSFDAGRADIKPALAAVLERVSESLRRQIGARITVSAPPDAGGPATLAQARATKVRDHLVTRHIAMPRILVAEGARAGGPVQLRMVLPATPISRLDDSSLAVPAKGVKPVGLTRPVAGEAAPAKPR